jgi:hypothetical protein
MTAGHPTPQATPPAAGRHAPLLRGYGKWLGILLIVIGLLQCAAWGFRVWILFLLSEGDPWLIVHTVVTLVSLGAAVLLLRIGIRARRQQPSLSDPAWIAASGLWIAGVGIHRFVAVLTHPMTDPNPRAHLHLSVLFMVLGAVLLGVAWFWKRNDLHLALRHRTPA